MGDPSNSGQEGLTSPDGCALKGRFFISVFDEAQVAVSGEGTRTLARAVSNFIRESGHKPC